MPLAISIVASQVISYTLKEIFEMNTTMHNGILANPHIKDGSLLMSLEFLLNVLQKESMLSVDLFYLIGTMPNGVYIEDLNVMFETDVENAIKKLSESCLIESDPNTNCYRVSPFID